MAMDRVPAYASDGYFSNDPDNQLEAQLRAFRDRRFPGVKIKIGQSPKHDAERVALAREVLGDEVLLMVDANGNYTVDQALESMRRIEGFDIHFYEEPLPPTDFAGYTELRARAPMPVATGEALYTAWDFKRLIEGRGADVLQPDLTMCGGFDETKAISTMARLANLRLSLHVWGGAVGLAAALHFLASTPPSPHTDRIPYPVLLEYDRGENALRDVLLAEPFPCVDGHLVVPTGPGLGIELNHDAVAKYRVG
jgi:D-galactarolactone cycloisomerase